MTRSESLSIVIGTLVIIVLVKHDVTKYFHGLLSDIASLANQTSTKTKSIKLVLIDVMWHLNCD